MQRSTFRQLAVWGLLLLGIAIAHAESGSHVPFETKGSVIKNHDGDTIKLATVDRGVLTIRLSGADTPETGQAYWKAARDYLTSRVTGVETNATCYNRDNHDREVCHVRVGTENLCEALNAKGYA